jgi:hypothetical protein
MRRVVIATVLALGATQGALAAAAIPSSELPGRERFRFVDPPAQRGMQPGQPSVQFPWDATPGGQGRCNVHVARTSAYRRLKRRGC